MHETVLALFGFSQLTRLSLWLFLNPLCVGNSFTVALSITAFCVWVGNVESVCCFNAQKYFASFKKVSCTAKYGATNFRQI